MKQNLKKRPCIKCGSSDALQPYYDTETGKTDGYCFACETSFTSLVVDDKPIQKKKYMNNMLTKEEVNGYPYREENDRGIYKEINERYGIRIGFNETTGTPDTVYYPYFIKGKLSGYKVRVLPKDFDHPNIGSIKAVDLFGTHLCDKKNKTIIITEGEEDCLSTCQILWEYVGRKRFPNVVSLVNGAQSVSKLEKDKEFLESFEKIILCFDNDKHGIKAREEVADILDPSKLYYMELSEKDANECLLKGKSDEVVKAYLSPIPHKPGGFFQGAEKWDEYLDTTLQTCYSYPETWKKFNEATYGMRFGELDTFTSGSGNGKTQLFREIANHLLTTTNHNIALLSLEESWRSVYDGLLGLALDKRIHLPDVRKMVTKEDLKRAKDKIHLDRVCFYDPEKEINIFATIKYLAEVKKCKFIFLDHLGMVLPQVNIKGSELERIDETMYRLKQFTTKYNIWVGLVVHLRKVGRGSTTFENGGIPTDDDLRGSGSLKQLSNSVYAIQRNRVHSNKEIRDVIALHVLKQRYTGRCGEMDFLKFNQDTGRLTVIRKPEVNLIEKNGSSDYNFEGDF